MARSPRGAEAGSPVSLPVSSVVLRSLAPSVSPVVSLDDTLLLCGDQEASSELRTALAAPAQTGKTTPVVPMGPLWDIAQSTERTVTALRHSNTASSRGHSATRRAPPRPRTSERARVPRPERDEI